MVLDPSKDLRKPRDLLGSAVLVVGVPHRGAAYPTLPSGNYPAPTRLIEKDGVAARRAGEVAADVHPAGVGGLLGFDHTKLTYRHAGRDFRLTDVHGTVVKDILA
jgi:hypothetical protein